MRYIILSIVLIGLFAGCGHKTDPIYIDNNSSKSSK
jgi:hypothetical protein